MIGTIRYASINSLLGIEQSRRDDIEALGYVVTYFFYGSLPWQSNKDKGKAEQFKILEKKLITPPEILCKKMPKQFMMFFSYVRKLKFEDRPDYSMLRNLFACLLFSKIGIGSKFCFDWFRQEDVVVRNYEESEENWEKKEKEENENENENNNNNNNKENNNNNNNNKENNNNNNNNENNNNNNNNKENNNNNNNDNNNENNNNINYKNKNNEDVSENDINNNNNKNNINESIGNDDDTVEFNKEN
jgi:flagellar biosynthesis GTPase FlhF